MDVRRRDFISGNYWCCETVIDDDDDDHDDGNAILASAWIEKSVKGTRSLTTDFHHWLKCSLEATNRSSGGIHGENLVKMPII